MANELEAGHLIDAYQSELAEYVRINVTLKAMISQKDREIQELKEKVNGHHSD